MNKNLVYAFTLSMFLFMMGISAGEEVVTLSSLLEEMTSRDAICHMPHYTCKQASSFDRAVKEPGGENWFANADFSQFIRSETRGDHEEWVLLDAEGPGALVHWWITAPQYECRFYIYIDGNEEPTFSGKADELVGGPLLAPALSLKRLPVVRISICPFHTERVLKSRAITWTRKKISITRSIIGLTRWGRPSSP